MQNDLIGLVRDNTALKEILATIDDRAAVDWNRRPDLEALPGITLKTISPGIFPNQDNEASHRRHRIQFDIWAEYYAHARNTAAALEKLLLPMRDKTQGNTIFIRSFLEGDRDLGATDQKGGTRVHHVSIDYMIHTRPKPAP